MYKEVFLKGKISLQGHPVPSVSSVASFALIFLLMNYFKKTKFISFHEQIMVMYFNIFLFEQ